VKPPRPDSLRLVTRADGARPPKPPLGVRAWTPAATSVAVLLESRTEGARNATTAAGVTDVASQIPAATELPPGTPVIVLGSAARSASLWGLVSRAVEIPRAVRCSALVARGYVDIGAGTDEVTGADLAWGVTPPC
jgi:hypothetical protein